MTLFRTVHHSYQNTNGIGKNHLTASHRVLKASLATTKKKQLDDFSSNHCPLNNGGRDSTIGERRHAPEALVYSSDANVEKILDVDLAQAPVRSSAFTAEGSSRRRSPVKFQRTRRGDPYRSDPVRRDFRRLVFDHAEYPCPNVAAATSCSSTLSQQRFLVPGQIRLLWKRNPFRLGGGDSLIVAPFVCWSTFVLSSSVQNPFSTPHAEKSAATFFPSAWWLQRTESESNVDGTFRMGSTGDCDSCLDTGRRQLTVDERVAMSLQAGIVASFVTTAFTALLAQVI
jgi:hypothetical protein